MRLPLATRGSLNPNALKQSETRDQSPSARPPSPGSAASCGQRLPDWTRGGSAGQRLGGGGRWGAVLLGGRTPRGGAARRTDTQAPLAASPRHRRVRLPLRSNVHVLALWAQSRSQPGLPRAGQPEGGGGLQAADTGARALHAGRPRPWLETRPETGAAGPRGQLCGLWAAVAPCAGDALCRAGQHLACDPVAWSWCRAGLGTWQRGASD